MAEPTLETVFGLNATQTIEDLLIKKNSLPGLTAQTENTGESLAVGLLLWWINALTETTQGLNPEQSITVTLQSPPNVITRNETIFQRHTFVIEIDKELSAAEIAIDPDNY